MLRKCRLRHHLYDPQQSRHCPHWASADRLYPPRDGEQLLVDGARYWGKFPLYFVTARAVVWLLRYLIPKAHDRVASFSFLTFWIWVFNIEDTYSQGDTHVPHQ